jgi:hypothetical protein
MMEEVWKPVKGYEGIYEVSNLGRVRSLDRYVERKNGYILPCKGSLIMPIHHKSGYIYIGLTKDGKKHNLKMHRIVAEAFIPNPHNLPEVNHKNEQPDDNRVENLEWCDRSHNIRWKDGHLRRAKKLWRPVEQYTLDGEYIKTFPSIIEAADAVGISRALIGNVCAQRTHQKSAGGYRWRYAE